MRRRRIVLGCALGAVAAGAFVLWPRGPAEPVYQGKGLSQWLAEATSDRLHYEQAKQALQAAGPNALPWLMSELTRPEPKWRRALFDFAERITGRRIGYPDQNRSWNAATGLRLMCPAAAPALPELDRHLYFGDYSSRNAAYAMAGGGEAALPYLLRGMNSTNPHVRSCCMDALGSLAHTTAAATPHLVRLFESPYPQVRIVPAAYLWDVTSYPELTIPALTIALWDPDSRVRNLASDSLARLRANSAPLVESLRRQMQDTNPAVALTASNALHLLENGPPPDPVTMAEAGESALPYVLECFMSSNMTVVTRSIAALGVLAPKMEAAVPPLVQALQSTNSLARKFAAVNLSGVRFHPELTIPALAAALSDSDAEVASAATWRLRYLRNNSVQLVPELGRLMDGTNAVLALAASNALHLLETTNPPPRRP